MTACGTVTWGWPPAIYGTRKRSAAQTALEFLAPRVHEKAVPRAGWRSAARTAFSNMITFLIAPPVAKALAAAGYTKQMIREYVYEHARVPLPGARVPARSTATPRRSRFPTWWSAGCMPKEYLVGRDELVRVLPSPDVIHIVVCGDPDRNRLMVLWGGYVSPVTRKIDA